MPHAPASPVHTGHNLCIKQCHAAANRISHIAILLGSTSRGVSDPSTSNLALFTLSLPSIAKTVECGFRYTIFLGYAEDPFYDSHAGSDALLVWFQNQVCRPLEERGILVDLAPVRIQNPDGKPGPVFNAVAELAHATGADFFYRSNDDTLLLTPWADNFVCALCSSGFSGSLAYSRQHCYLSLHDMPATSMALVSTRKSLAHVFEILQCPDRLLSTRVSAGVSPGGTAPDNLANTLARSTGGVMWTSDDQKVRC